ncbi:MAG: serine hydrolase, partial [Clostridia bacterium]|nr:serine hydrolase [Clostridia bacterium]
MKKFFYCFVLMMLTCVLIACTGMAPKEQVIGSDNCYMVDFNSGRVLYAKGENDRKPIASMVKIMTLLIAFENVDSGKISLNQKVTI